MTFPSASRPASPTPSNLPPVPSSPVYSVASTANPMGMSTFNLPLPPPPRPAHAVLTKADLERSQDAYSELLSTAKAYRVALASLSTAASNFGAALESCARLKEATSEPVGPLTATTNMSASFTTKGSCTADTLLAASGVQHLVANHQQILSETVYRSFEVPLLHDLDKWRAVIDDEEETYQQKMRAQSREIKRLEKEGMKLHKQRKRDLANFRAHLVELTTKIDGLTTLHSDHARTLLRESQETSGRIVEASCSLVRAEVDIFEGLARKGWTGGGLDELLDKGQDLFAPEDISAAVGAPAETAKLFSILPPKSILADSTSDGSRAVGHHVRSDSLDTGQQYQSLAALAEATRGADTESIMSAELSKPRNARPFSPQPIRRRPTDVTIDSFGAPTPLSGDESSPTETGDEDAVHRSKFRMPSIDTNIKEEDDEADDETIRDHADSNVWRRKSSGPPRGRRSPEFITDESSSSPN